MAPLKSRATPSRLAPRLCSLTPRSAAPSRGPEKPAASKRAPPAPRRRRPQHRGAAGGHSEHGCPSGLAASAQPPHFPAALTASVPVLAGAFQLSTFRKSPVMSLSLVGVRVGHLSHSVCLQEALTENKYRRVISCSSVSGAGAASLETRGPPVSQGSGGGCCSRPREQAASAHSLLNGCAARARSSPSLGLSFLI